MTVQRLAARPLSSRRPASAVRVSITPAAGDDAAGALFRNPPARLRSKVFWSWNGELDEAKIRAQIRAMRDMGLGGFYMHARVGLSTPFLSEKWFAMVRAAADEAGRCGLEAWIYDEDRYPSGAAGGLATRDPRFRARRLVCAADATGGEAIARFRIERRGERLARYARLADGAAADDGDGETLRFSVRVEPPDDWYNGASALDSLNRAATDEFLRVAYESYASHCGDLLGGALGGVFTDEPSYGHLLLHGEPPGLPWTGGLAEDFEAGHGYSLLDRLPDLFYDVDAGDAGKTRYDYVKFITRRFAADFMTPLADFCARRHMRLTGHMRQEDTLRHQTSLHGSCMAALEPMQLPGIDYLTEQRRTWATCKYASSVARQFGREGALSEMYGGTGWDFGFAAQKAMGDMQFALGITRRCLHHFFYTLAGEAKRDFPPSFSPFSPWWREYGALEDYFGRLAAFAEGARPLRDIAVINPVESMWTRVRLGWFEARENDFLERDRMALEDALLAEQLDFDYVDEELLSRRGDVPDDGGKPRLRMGLAEYRIVLVPSVLTLRASTAALLERFIALGGPVVFAGNPPDRLDGRRGRFPQTLFARARIGTTAEAVASARPFGHARVIGAGGRAAPGVLCAAWETADDRRLFLCNTGYSPTQLRESGFACGPRVAERRTALEDARLIACAGCEGEPELWDPFTGERRRVSASRQTDGSWRMPLSLAPRESLALVFPKTPRRTALPAARPRPPASAGGVLVLPEPFAARLDEPNVLVLDRAALRMPGEPPRFDVDVRVADALVRGAMGWKPHGPRMRQPWSDPGLPGEVPVTLDFAFTVAVRPEGEVWLAAEHMEKMTAALDGLPLPLAPEGHWIDDSLAKARVPAERLAPGPHVLRIAMRYEYASSLEALYWLGDFGVSPEAEMTAPARTLRAGDWTRQGLKFYSGNVACSWDVVLPEAESARVFLTLPRGYAGSLAAARFNGRLEGRLMDEPFELELAGRGPGRLEIEVFGSRRNSHGPLHLCRWPFASASPDEFNPDEYRYCADWALAPLGLPEMPRIRTVS